jgi:hypothetical protein
LEYRGGSDKTNQRSYWNTGVILIKQIRGTPLICFIRITLCSNNSSDLFYQNHPVLEHRGDSDKTNQGNYWNTGVILIKQIRGVIGPQHDSDKTNQRCYIAPSALCTSLICFIRNTSVFSPLICFIRITLVFTPLICFIRITPVFTPLICFITITPLFTPLICFIRITQVFQ